MGVPVLIVVAWGALAFGSVYPWAYRILLTACAATALWGFVRRVPSVRRRLPGPLAAGLLLMAAAIGVQLVPLDRATLVRLSPATDQFLREYDVTYAMRAAYESRRAWSAVAPADPGPESQEPASLAHPLSVDPPRTRLGLVFVCVFALFTLGLARGLDGRDLRVIAPGIAVLGVVMALVGIIQKALWSGLVYGFWEPINPKALVFGPFINRNHFAGWMLLALPLVIGSLASKVTKGMVNVKPDWRSRVTWFSTPEASRAVLTGFAVLLMALGLTLTFSRSGISCLLLALVVSSAIVLRRQSSSAKGRLLAAYLAFVFVAAVTWAGTDAIGQRFSQADLDAGTRTGAWGDAWRIHRMFPVFGTGFNTYGTATTVLQEFARDIRHYAEAHNDYLQVLVEGGFLVAVPVVLVICALVGQIRQRFREGRDDRTGYWLRIGAVTSIVAIAFQSTVEFSLQMPGNFALFAVMCAIAVRRATPKE